RSSASSSSTPTGPSWNSRTCRRRSGREPRRRPRSASPSGNASTGTRRRSSRAPWRGPPGTRPRPPGSSGSRSAASTRSSTAWGSSAPPAGRRPAGRAAPGRGRRAGRGRKILPVPADRFGIHWARIGRRERRRGHRVAVGVERRSGAARSHAYRSHKDPEVSMKQLARLSTAGLVVLLLGGLAISGAVRSVLLFKGTFDAPYFLPEAGQFVLSSSVGSIGLTPALGGGNQLVFDDTNTTGNQPLYLLGTFEGGK